MMKAVQAETMVIMVACPGRSWDADDCGGHGIDNDHRAGMMMGCIKALLIKVINMMCDFLKSQICLLVQLAQPV